MNSLDHGSIHCRMQTLIKVSSSYLTTVYLRYPTAYIMQPKRCATCFTDCLMLVSPHRTSCQWLLPSWWRWLWAPVNICEEKQWSKVGFAVWQWQWHKQTGEKTANDDSDVTSVQQTFEIGTCRQLIIRWLQLSLEFKNESASEPCSQMQLHDLAILKAPCLYGRTAEPK